MFILSLSNMYVFLLKGEGVTSRNAVGGVSFYVCLVLTLVLSDPVIGCQPNQSSQST